MHFEKYEFQLNRLNLFLSAAAQATVCRVRLCVFSSLVIVLLQVSFYLSFFFVLVGSTLALYVGWSLRGIFYVYGCFSTEALLHFLVSLRTLATIV